jgi:hypothetical protein
MNVADDRKNRKKTEHRDHSGQHAEFAEKSIPQYKLPDFDVRQSKTWPFFSAAKK